MFFTCRQNFKEPPSRERYRCIFIFLIQRYKLYLIYANIILDIFAENQCFSEILTKWNSRVWICNVQITFCQFVNKCKKNKRGGWVYTLTLWYLIETIKDTTLCDDFVFASGNICRRKTRNCLIINIMRPFFGVVLW